MGDLNSQHHITLEEIKRLENERDLISAKISALRSTLPKAEPVTFAIRSEGRTVPVTVDAQQIPVSVAMAAVKPATLPPRVSDHAVIRFLERKYSFAFEAARNELLSDTVKLAIKMGAQSVKGHGGRLIIKGNQIVTFVPGQDQRSTKARAAARRKAAR